MSDIKDRDVKMALEQILDAADTLKIEYANKEAECEDLTQTVADQDDKIEALKEELDEQSDLIESLRLEISSLEDALAEAYLTQQVDNE